MLESKYAIYFKTLVYLIFILIFSYSSSFLAPRLYFLTDCCYQYYILALPGILFTILLLSLLFYLLRSSKVQLSKWKNFSVYFRLKKFTFLMAAKALGILIFFYILQLIFDLMLEYFGVSILNNEITQFKNTSENFKLDKFAIYLYATGLLLIAIVEEFFWRGYLLPLQEQKIGNKAWLLNGTLWAVSHILVFNPLQILILSIGFSYVASTYKNLWFTIFFHLLLNGLYAYQVLKVL